MRIILLFLILILGFYKADAQDQEMIWAREDFEKNYKKENYNIDNNKVVKIEKKKYTFKEETIIIEESRELELLIENNLLTYLYQDNDSVARTYYVQNLKKVKHKLAKNKKRYSIWISMSCRRDLGEICYYISLK